MPLIDENIPIKSYPLNFFGSDVHWQTPTNNFLHVFNLFTCNHFLDIIGELSAIRSTINDNLPGAKRIMLTLRLDSAVKVWAGNITVFSEAVKKVFDRQVKEQTSKRLHPRWFMHRRLSHLPFQSLTNLLSLLILRCSKKLVREISSFTCAQGIGVHAQVDTELHRSLAEIVGKTYTFHKLNDFNFASKHQTFTISRIFPERELAPMPAFVIPLVPFLNEGANAPEEALHEVVAPGTEEKDANTCNVAEESHPRLMLPLPDVLHRPKNKLLLIGMPARKHVWNESTTSS
ncbi:hypothetical protein HID58_090495 [Brassica napus]|uniref:Uncharacterized protein n=1 Tax=Brassica napus TaxID=3708 RepID=A0ABQ7WYN3_BRANA|nr:hypothetical protein HID58_090495 [Brassica napus]